jgi:Thioester domain
LLVYADAVLHPKVLDMLPARSLLLAATAIVALLAIDARRPPPSAAQPAMVALHEAIEKGMVDAEFIGTGSASGASIRLRLTRRTPEDVILTVPLGMRLLNADPTEQDMVVRRLLGESTGGSRYTPLTTIELRDDQQRTYVLEGYCLEAELDNPSNGAVFTYDGFVDAGIVAVLDAASRVRGADDAIVAVQAAVWVLTDDISAGELSDIGYGLSAREVDLVRSLIEAAGYDPAGFRLFG